MEEEDFNSEQAFIGVCETCGSDVNEGDERLCPTCGAIYHDWCVKETCSRCDAEIEEW
jgi:rRNA maturation endonuclease Nob1